MQGAEPKDKRAPGPANRRVSLVFWVLGPPARIAGRAPLFVHVPKLSQLAAQLVRSRDADGPDESDAPDESNEWRLAPG